jgi:hypothetical protein
MTAGPSNVLLFKKRQEQAMAEQRLPKVCPFSIQAGEQTNVTGPDGKPLAAPIKAVRCIGPQCMAFTTVNVQAPDKSVQQISLCGRLLDASSLNGIDGSLQTLLAMFKLDLESRGVKVVIDQPAITKQ